MADLYFFKYPSVYIVWVLNKIRALEKDYSERKSVETLRIKINNAIKTYVEVLKSQILHIMKRY